MNTLYLASFGDFVERIGEFCELIYSKALALPMIICLLGTGVLLTFRNKFKQVTKFPTAFKSTFGPTFKSIGASLKDYKFPLEKRMDVRDEKKAAENAVGVKSVSPFEAFSTAIAGTIGTGNVVGVTTAMVLGGPGAVFWMWISAFFGMMTSFAEKTLGVYFRKKTDDGKGLHGGPMFYIQNGLKCKWLAIVFCVGCVLASISMNMVQASTISATMNQGFNIPKWVTGIVVAVIIGLVILGGISRIGKVASYIVPFMAIYFVAMTLIIICMHIKQVPEAFGMIFKYAFNFKAGAGGLAGYGIALSMRQGFAKGVFSNEAGLGSSVIAHSASDTTEPVRQGMWGIVEVFVVTMVICTLTALVNLTTGVLDGIYEGASSSAADGAIIAQSAFSRALGVVGKVSYSIILPLFAFTTILSWSYYGEESMQFMLGKKSVIFFKMFYVGIIMLGSVITSNLAFQVADIFNFLMCIPNLVCLVGLSGLTVSIIQNYFQRKAGLNVEPMLSAYPEDNAELKKKLEDEERVKKQLAKDYEFIYEKPVVKRSIDDKLLTENAARVVIFTMLTFGVYGWIYIYNMIKWLAYERNDDCDIVLRFLSTFIPFYHVYWAFRAAVKIEKIAKSYGITELRYISSPLLFVYITNPLVGFAYLVNYMNRLYRDTKKIKQQREEEEAGQAAQNA